MQGASSPATRSRTCACGSTTAPTTPSTPRRWRSRWPASQAMKQALEQADPVLLEPIMVVDRQAPEDTVGDVIGDLNSRRGRPLGHGARRARHDRDQGGGADGGDALLRARPALDHRWSGRVHDGVPALRGGAWAPPARSSTRPAQRRTPSRRRRARPPPRPRCLRAGIPRAGPRCSSDGYPLRAPRGIPGNTFQPVSRVSRTGACRGCRRGPLLSLNVATKDIRASAADEHTVCDVCGRTLLRGEQAHPYLDGVTHRAVCELCVGGRSRRAGSARGPRPPTRAALPRRTAAGRCWDDCAGGAMARTTSSRPRSSEAEEGASGGRPRRAAPARGAGASVTSGRSPAARENKVSSARVEVFNASEHPRTLAGIARSLGFPIVSVRPVPERPSLSTSSPPGSCAGTGTRWTSPTRSRRRPRGRPGRRAHRAGQAELSPTRPATSAARWCQTLELDEGSMAAICSRL